MSTTLIRDARSKLEMVIGNVVREYADPPVEASGWDDVWSRVEPCIDALIAAVRVGEPE